MGAAAAAESPADANNVTMNSIDDAASVVSEDAGGAEPLLGASNDENLLSAGSGSFKDLEDYINNNKGYEKTVYLNQDYKFDSATDIDYNTTGIYLGTYTSIDGQGHTIDASNTRYIFNVIGQDVVIKNIVFKNTNYRAIEVASPNVEISGCTFDNNTDRAVGLSANALNCVIDDCKFSNGGGLSSGATGTIISNSIFKNNTNGNGAAVNIASTDVVVENCVFDSNHATYGGAIYFKYDPTYGKLTIKDSTFKSNDAEVGGAIYIQDYVVYNNAWTSKYNTVEVISSEFTDNRAAVGRELGSANADEKAYIVDSETSRDGGHYYDEIDELFDGVHDGTITLTKDYKLTKSINLAITGQFKIEGNGHTIDANGNHFIISHFPTPTWKYFDVNNLTIVNGYSTNDGGAINYQGYLSYFRVQNSKFINNTATGRGGACYVQATGPTVRVIVNDVQFINNTAGTTGGALYLRESARFWNTPTRVDFINNTASLGGAIYTIRNAQVTFNYCTFVGNKADSNPVLYSSNCEHLFKNSQFYNNTAYSSIYGTCSFQENNTFDEGILISDLGTYFDNTNESVNVDKNTYYYGSSQPIPILNANFVNGNGCTIIGNGQGIFSIKKNDVTIKDMILINCTISASFLNNITLDNIVFINCTLPINVNNGANITNSKFINCTKPISNLYSSNFQNCEINEKAYSSPLTIPTTWDNPVNNDTINVENKVYEVVESLSIRGNNLTIDGHGATVISLYGNPIFNIYGKNITIQNFNLKNASTAINFRGWVDNNPPKAWVDTNYLYTGSVINTTFEDVGTGVYFTAANGTVINCTFNNASTRGAYFGPNANGAYATIINSTFEDIKTSSSGAAIYVAGNNKGTIDNCTFNNITTFGNGAIYFEINGDVTKSTFEDCSAFSGGSIYEKLPSGTVYVSNSTFDGGVAKSSGGAIYVEGTLILDDCSLNNNTADASGAIYSHGSLNITNSSLTNNSAVKGGALVSDGDNPVISGCNVSGNKADVGAGISLSGDNAVIDNVNFTDNTASVRGGALVTTGANTNVTNVNATGNSAPTGSAFVLDGTGATLANSTIANNTGVNGEGSAVEVNGEGINVLNNTVHGNDGAGVLVNGNGTNITGNHFNSTRDISINPNSDIYNNDTIMKKLQDENYPAGKVEILNDVEPTIIVPDVNVQQNTTFNITIQNNDFKGNVSVKLDNGSLLYNGTFNAIKDNEGIITGPVLPVAGEKTVTVFFYGDPDFTNKTVNTTFIVSRVTPQMNITVANVTYGNNSIVEVRIGNKANGTITITIDDVEITSIPIVDGNATYDLGVLPGGNKTANVQFRYNTSDYYNNNVGNFTSFCVDKAESSISIVVNDTYDIGEDVNITVSTTGSSGNLTFKINDTMCPVVNGTVNLTDLQLGEYTITATLDADENYTNAEFTKTFTIKKINTDLILLKK